MMMLCKWNVSFAEAMPVADSVPTQGKLDLIDIYSRWFKKDTLAITDSIRANKKIHFSLLPAAGASAGGGKAFVTVLNAAFYTGDSRTTSLSTVTFSPWFTFDGKFVLPFRNLVWLPDDFFLWKGDTRFMIYPQYTWGLGGDNNVDDKLLLQYNYLRLYHSLLKKVGRKLYFGAGLNLDHHFNIKLEEDSAVSDKIPVFDYDGDLTPNTTSFGTVLNFAIDTRRNSNNPKGGIYLAADYRLNPEFLGSTRQWQSIFVDIRKYFPFSTKRQNLLALRTFYWGVTSGKPPYLDLPAIGWDYYNRSGRGIQQNRYRSKSILYGESEYRRDLSANGFWGFVVFMNITAPADYVTTKFTYWHPAGGVGLRIKFNKVSDANICIDFAMSKDYAGIYLGLGELF
ncbi:MAG TPA: hypothetical protein VFV68_07260 [Agriterribacter sp.]|nr:hypothetical protein [Agriterribacter sp.]